MIARTIRIGFLWSILATASLTAVVPTKSAESGNLAIVGEWHGFVDVPLSEIALAIRLQHLEDGQWTGEIDIPEQGVTNAPLYEIVIENKTISFSLKSPAAVAVFQGTFVNDDQEINGRVIQGTRTLPFKLARGEVQPASAGTTAPVITLADVDGIPSNRPSLALVDHPAILYSTKPATDAVADLNRKLQDGTIQLKFDGTGGYLRSVLDALKISIDTQMVVFSKTSVQAARINPTNPRALFFRDDVAVGFIRNAPFLEFTAQDPQQGVIFYTLDQRDTVQPRFVRRNTCLNCHVTRNSMDVPGLLVRSVVTGPDGRTFEQFGSYHTDDRSPWEQRWGGWYVTGTAGSALHMGNAMLVDRNKPEELIGSEPQAVTSLAGRFDADGYPSPYSDIAALMVFEHQSHATNLLIRLGWDARAVLYQEQKTDKNQNITRRLLNNDAREVIDYLLFIDEAPFVGRIQPSSAFATTFSAQGPYDSKGRTLRQLDLQQRLLRYPCSYMIYSTVFDALPVEAKDALYRRMWKILSGQEKNQRYQRLSATDRRAVIEILRDTKKDFPDYFK